MKILYKFLRLKIFEKLLVITTLILGITLTINSAFFIWAYNFSSILFLFMMPMTILISEFIIGLTLVFSGYYLIVNRMKSILLYKISGILIILYSINHSILTQIDNSVWHGDYKNPYFILPFGVLIILISFIPKYRSLDKKYKIINSEMVKICIGVALYLIIDILFYSWNYLDKTL